MDSIIVDAAISTVLLICGGLFGMDKTHDIRDWVGPILIIASGGYAFYSGLEIYAYFIFAIAAVKLFFRDT